jgi:hypothetical protein
MIELKNIKQYIENYLKRIFNENINIETKDNYYIINDNFKVPIYEFWNKSDEELLNDFNDFSFKKDYIGTIFFFLSGYWEYIHNEIKDNYGRFSALESFQHKKNIIEEPVVDILVEKIKEKLNLTYKNENPRAYITHDIDFLGLPKGFQFIKSIGGDVLKRKDFKIAFDKMRRKIINDDPHSVNRLIDIHKKYSTKGTFFFMPDIQPKETVGGYNVKKNEESLKDIEKKILNINSKVGIHYDVRHLKENRMKNDIEKLNNIFETKIESGRAHFLIFDIRKSFDVYEKADLKIDTTGSFADRVGFRFGTSKPFNPYNFKENREYNLIEIPLIVMDGSLQNENYMNLSPEEGFEKIKELIDKIKKYKGTFTFLWHNTSFYTHLWKDWEWVYEETLKYLKNNNFEFI